MKRASAKRKREDEQLLRQRSNGGECAAAATNKWTYTENQPETSTN